MNNNKVLNILRSSGALQEGHFILSSGLHSKHYVQCAKLFSKPWMIRELCQDMALDLSTRFKKIDLILAPAFGGLFFAYELSLLLKVPNIFCERVDGKFALRRGFSIPASANVLIVEDVITTGKSTLECVDLITMSNAKTCGVACVINRMAEGSHFPYQIVPSINLNFPTYQPNSLPSELEGLPATKPGSRGISTVSNNNNPKLEKAS